VYHEVAPDKDASGKEQVSGSMPKSDRGAPGFGPCGAHGTTCSRGGVTICCAENEGCCSDEQGLYCCSGRRGGN